MVKLDLKRSYSKVDGHHVSFYFIALLLLQCDSTDYSVCLPPVDSPLFLEALELGGLLSVLSLVVVKLDLKRNYSKVDGRHVSFNFIALPLLQ